MEVPNLGTYMEKNMSKIFGVTIIKSPFAPFRLCLFGKAKKTVAATLNGIISQIVKIQRLKFDMVLVQVVRLKILRLEVP